MTIALNSNSDSARVSACNIILDRAWGKARQSKHQHHVQHEQAITHVDLAGQVDLRRLSNDELREFELSNLRAAIRNDSIQPSHTFDDCHCLAFRSREGP